MYKRFLLLQLTEHPREDEAVAFKSDIKHLWRLEARN